MKIERIYNFVKLSDRIGTSGYPENHEFQYIKDNDYEVVINLISNDPNDVLRKTEKDIVENLGLAYVHIPVVWESPSIDNFKIFCETLEKYQNQKIFIHCELNMRVSVFMMLYRVIYEGIDEKEAMVKVHEVWKPHDQWEVFIDAILHESREWVQIYK